MTKKRILSFLLAVVLAFNCGIVMVFAETLAGPGEPAVSTGGNEPAEFSGTADPVAEVRALMDELPTGEELEDIEPAEKDGVCTQIMEAYNAYEALSEEEKEQIPEGAAFFEELLASFESGIAPLAASDTDVAYPVVGGNIYFDPTTGTITECDTTVTEANIPNQIEGVTVTDIYEFAFFSCNKLQEITLPPNLKSISGGLFSGCESLTLVTLPENLESIGQAAFLDCANLTSITIPESVTTIKQFAFNRCSNLTSVVIQGNPSVVGGIFEGCTKLKTAGPLDGEYSVKFGWEGTLPAAFRGGSLVSIVIPENITTISTSAFENCVDLESVMIPASVTEMGYRVFYKCDKLLTAGPSDENYNIQFGWKDYIPENAFSKSSLTSVVLPDGITAINNSAFERCEKLTSVIIPGSVTTIDIWAFEESRNLTTAGPIGGDYHIQFGWTTKIPDNAFAYENFSLFSVVIPDEVTEIGSGAFKGRSEMSSIKLPESLTTIGSGAFEDCSGLTSLPLSEGVTTIGEHAFDGCSGLTDFKIPKDVSAIAAYTFYGCSQLADVLIPENVITIDEYAFGNCSELTSVTLPNYLTAIGESAFRNCTSLANIVIPAKVEVIEQNVFSGCTDLNSVTISDGVAAIERNAFEGCTNLTELIIPGTVTEIAGLAFFGCDGLVSAGPIDGNYNVKFGWTESIPKSFLSQLSSLTTLVLPESINSLGALPNNLTTAGPIGGDYDVQFGWQEKIPESAFVNSKLTSITIPDSISTIGSSAFYNCDSLTSVIFPANVNSIEDEAFLGCSSLRNVTILSKTTKIGSRVFASCDNLTDVYYVGSEADWTTTQGAESGLADTVTIHYNSTGPDGSINSDYSSVKFLNSFDAAKKQVFFADSGSDPLVPYELAASVDETTMEQLVGKYVLVTVDPLSAFTVTDLQAVDAKIGTVLETGENLISFEEGVYLSVSPNRYIDLKSYEGKTVIYFSTKEEGIMQLNELVERTGVYQGWNEEAKEVTISGRSYSINYLTDMGFLTNNSIVEGKEIQYLTDDNGYDGAVFKIILKPEYRWEIKQFQNYDIFTNTIYFADGTSLAVGPELQISIGDFLNCWVVYQVEDHPEFGERIVQIKKLEPALKVSIKLSEDRLLYQDDKLTFTQTAGGIDYRDKDGFEIPFTVTIMTDDTSGGVVEIPAEVLESNLLDIEVTNAGFTVPEGFSLEWVDGDGCQLLQTPFTLKRGETLKVGGYIRVDRSLDLPSIQNTYTLQGSVGSSAGSKSMEDAFSIQNLDLQQEQANANHEEREDSANKELADEVKDFANSWDKFVMLPSDLESLLEPAQAEKLKKLITLWITAISTEPEFEGLDEKIRDEAIDAFVEQWNQIFDYKIEGSWITSWFGVKKVKSTILVEMDTKNYGTKRFEISYNGQVYSSNEADFGDLGTLTWCMLDNEGNPSAALKGNNVGLSGGTDVKAFSDALYDIGEKAIKDFYKETIGKPVDNLVGYIFGNVTQRLLSKFGIKVSDTIFTLYTNAMKSTVVRCPVDVFVYDVDGNLCGSIVDNQVQEDDPTVSLYVDGDDKYIWYAGDDYKIRLEGTDTGTMDYEVYEYAGGELLRQVAFHDVPLTNSVVYNGEIPLELYVDAEDYSLTAEDGTRILADLDTYSPPPKIDLSNNENAPEIDSLEAEFNDDGTVSFQALTSDPDANIVSVQLTCLVGQDVLSQMMEEQDGSWLKTLSLPDGITQVQAFIMVVDADGNQVVSTPQVFSVEEGGGDDRPENPAGGEGEDIHPSIPPENDGGYVENGANSDLQNGEQNSWNRVEDQHNSDDVSNSGKENPGTGGNHGHGIVEIETNDLPERVSVYGALITVLIVMGGAGIWLWRSKEKR